MEELEIYRGCLNALVDVLSVGKHVTLECTVLLCAVHVMVIVNSHRTEKENRKESHRERAPTVSRHKAELQISLLAADHPKKQQIGKAYKSLKAASTSIIKM